MRTMKSASSGRISGLMDLPAARQQVRPRMRQLVLEWRRQHPTLMHISSEQLTFLEDFSLRRQDNGCIQLVAPYSHPYMPREANIGIDRFMDWLFPAVLMKIRMLVLAEINRLTGRKSVNPLDLGNLDQECDSLVGVLTGDVGPIQLKLFEKDIQDFLDPEIWAIAHRARDTFTSLATYNIIAANRETWLSLEAQAPSLMPLVSFTCRQNKISFDQNAFRSLKQYAKRHGLTEAGWKALCNFPISHVHALLGDKLEECFRLASHYGEIGLPPPLTLIWHHLDFCQKQRLPAGSVPAWFDGAAIREFQRLKKEDGGTAVTFANAEYTIALDWLGDYLADGKKPDTHQKQAGWQWIQRQSDAWHEEQVRKQVSNDVTWSSALTAYKDGGYDVVPLITSAELAVEGVKMHHCVGSYAGYCNEGRSRIFSIRKDGKSLATAELVRLSHGWLLNQNRGPCNSDPGPEIRAVAQRLEARYNAAMLAW